VFSHERMAAIMSLAEHKRRKAESRGIHTRSETDRAVAQFG
jgi:hypothetical protein